MFDEENDNNETTTTENDNQAADDEKEEGGDDKNETNQEDSADEEDEDIQKENKGESDNDDDQNDDQDDEEEEKQKKEEEDQEQEDEEEEKEKDEEEEKDDDEEEEEEQEKEEEEDDDQEDEKEEEEEEEEEEDQEEEEEEEDQEDDENENIQKDSDDRESNNEQEEEEESDENEEENENQDDKLKEKIQNWCNENENYEEQGKFDDIIIKADFCLKQIDFEVEDQDQNKKQFNNARICINQILYDDNLIKDDFMRLTFCFQYGYLKLQEYEQQESSPVVKACFEKYQMEFDQVHLAFIEQIQEMCERSTQYQSIEQCVFSISGLDSDVQQQGISIYNCIKNRSDQHNDIYPTCYQTHYNSFDEVHEQFDELVQLNCSNVLEEVIQTTLASADLSKKVTNLKQCINNISFEEKLPKDQYLEVADCYQNELKQLQFTFLSKK
ncbi:hypothetical protein ABPG72_010299 [Tetrahymena utriculariae]